MDDRRKFSRELDELQQLQRELEILYEQYFAGLERREPLVPRNTLSRRLRQLTNRRIVWTDLKFRYHGINSRFMSYSQYWDRILRLIEEGKYHRHKTKVPQPFSPEAKAPDTAPPPGYSEAQKLQQQLSTARKSCGIAGPEPSVEKLTEFMASQRDTIRVRFGDKPVEFLVETQDGKPRVKVRLKQSS